VPMFTCGLVRSNLLFAIDASCDQKEWFIRACGFGDAV